MLANIVSDNRPTKNERTNSTLKRSVTPIKAKVNQLPFLLMYKNIDVLFHFLPNQKLKFFKNITSIIV